MLRLWISLLLVASFQTPATTGVTVSGRVVPLNSPAITGAGKVTLMPTTSAARLETAIRPDGSFEFQGVSPGTYRITSTPGVQTRVITVTVSDKNLSDIELLNPRTVEVTGNVVVENGGLRPGFSLLFSPYAGSTTGIALISSTGGFKTVLPEGDYRVSWNSLPEGFSVRSIVVGSTDLLSRPLTVTGAAVSGITLTLGVSSPPPWVKVSGRVTGLSGTAAPPSLTLTDANQPLQSFQSRVQADGTFEFPMILPGFYTAQLVPAPPSVPPNLSIYVGRKDVDGVQIAIPVTRCIPGQVVVDGNGPIPPLSFSLTPSTTPPVLNVRPPESGQFGILLPEGERRITLNPTSLPQGYRIKSFTYGSTDLLRDPLRVAGGDPSKLLLTLEASPGSWVRVSGRVTGIDPRARPYTVTMAVGATEFRATVQPDASFSFDKVWRGSYTMQLVSMGGIPASKAVTVPAQDITGLEFAAPPQKEVTGRVTVEGAPGFTSFLLTLRGSSAGAVGVTVTAGADGNFKIALPEGESQVSVSGVPPGSVKWLTYGGVDLLKSPLRVTRDDTAELQVSLAVNARGGVLGGILNSGPSSCVPSGR